MNAAYCQRDAGADRERESPSRKLPDGREVREETWLRHEVTGAWPGPDEFIEHADGSRAHNDPRNLRLVQLARGNAAETKPRLAAAAKCSQSSSCEPVRAITPLAMRPPRLTGQEQVAL